MGPEYAADIANLLQDTYAALLDGLGMVFPPLGMLDELFGLLADILSDPIVLDLDGDGIELIPLTQSATMFDLDGDGELERTGWVSPQDGFLVHDANGNGTVDGVGELFGSANVDGYDELETLDSNNDGRIDASDAEFLELRVWRDLNSDGISTADELQTLTEAGISSLSLAYSQMNQDVDGNIIARAGTYVRADGTSRSMGSVNFALEESIPTIPQEADLTGLALLPNVSGQLGLPDLRTAMFFDPMLRAMVEDLVYGSHDFDTFAEFCDSGFLDVLYRWAGIDPSVPLGPDDPPLHFQLMSAFLGRPFDELNSHQIERLEEEVWPNFVQQIGVSFIVQAATLPQVSVFHDINAQLAALDPSDAGFASAVGVIVQNGVAASGAAVPAYAYLDQFAALSWDISTGELTGDFDAFVAAFIDDQPSFFTATYVSGGGGGGGGGGAISMGSVGSGSSSSHPWTAWFQDQGSLLFAIGQMMGLGPEYVLAVSGWKWLAGGFSTHEGTSGNDLLDFTVTTYENSGIMGVFGPSSGSTHDQMLFGYEGNDELRGNDGTDRLIGGTGDDLLKGGSGSDFYVYASGDGLDRISETSGADDTIYFSSELNSADLQVARVPGTNDLLLHFGDPAQGIILTSQWSSSSVAVEHFQFVGEQGLDAGDIASRYLATLATVGADTIVGSWADERINGGDGNDTLSGGAGNDILDGGAGADTLKGGDGADVLLAGAGNDRLEGGDQSDTYVYAVGDGDDVIYDYQQSDNTATDTLVLGAGIAPSDIVFSRTTDNDDVKISFSNATGSIFLDNQWWGDAGIEKIEFADGTVWTQLDIAARYVAAQTTTGNDTIWGSNFNDVIEAGAGADTLQGYSGNDTLVGGTGNDQLRGGTGSDTYIYNAGDGDDVLYDYQQSDNAATDTLIFGQGITAASVVFSRTTDKNDVKLSFTVQSGSIVLDNQWWGDAGVESIQFADGTVWTQAQLASFYVAAQSTAGNDTIWGSSFGDNAFGGAGADTIQMFSGADTLTGGLGNDRLEGGEGADIYVYNIGDGDDVIYDYRQSDNTATDVLIFGEGISIDDLIFSRPAGDSTDLLITFQNQSGSILIDHQTWSDSGIELFQFADGSTLTAAQADLLIGG